MENLPMIVENVFQPSQFVAATSSASSSVAGNLPAVFWWTVLIILAALLTALYFSLKDSKQDDLDGYLQP